MAWIARLVVRRIVWIVVGLAVFAVLNVASVRASAEPGSRPVPVAPATHCDGVTADEGTEPCPTLTPTPEPTPTPTPEPTPTVVHLSGEDRDRIDLLQGSLVGGVVVVVVLLTSIAITSGLRR